MKTKPILIILLVALLCGGLLACNRPSAGSEPPLTPEAGSTTEEVAPVTSRTTSKPDQADEGHEGDEGDLAEAITPSAEWVAFEEPLGLFTFHHPASANFMPQMLQHELFDYGYNFFTSDGNQTAITFKRMPAAASDEAWQALGESPQLLTMLEEEFGLGGFVEEERRLGEAGQRLVYLEGVFSEVQYSVMRLEEREGIWVLMGIFFPVDNPPVWQAQSKEAIERFTWSPDKFQQAMASLEQNAGHGAEEEPMPQEAPSPSEVESWLFSDPAGIFIINYPGPASDLPTFTGLKLDNEGYNYTFSTSDQQTALNISFYPLKEPIRDEQWASFAKDYFQRLSSVDPNTAQLTIGDTSSGQHTAILDVPGSQQHRWLRLAESDGILALMSLSIPASQWSALSNSRIFQSWNELIWYPQAAQAFFAAQATLVPYDHSAGGLSFRHPPDFKHVYDGVTEQPNADYGISFSNAAELDIESDVLDIAILLQHEDQEAHEFLTMLANPEDPNWSWTGEAGSQRGYTYIDLEESVILTLAEAIDGHLITATWFVSRDTWQYQRGAIIASLQSLTWSPEAARQQ